jgi:hypothetical protein
MTEWTLTTRVDMDMHRCLPVLHKQGMGAGKTPSELERDRPLVIGARVWLAVRLYPVHVRDCS